MDPMAVIAKHSMPEGRPAGHRIAFASGLLARLRVSDVRRPVACHGWPRPRRECATGDVSNPGPGDAPESVTRSPVSAASELRNCGDVINGISAETSVRVPGPREHCSVVKGKGMYGSPAAFTLCSGAREGQSETRWSDGVNAPGLPAMSRITAPIALAL